MSRLVDTVAPRRLGTNFRWLLGSTWISQVGDGIALAAGPLLVASETHDPFLVAMGALVQRLPWLLFGLYAGVVADRMNRVAVVITVNLMRVAVLLVLVLTLSTGAVNIGLVLVALFLFGTAEVFADTTSSTLLPMVVSSARMRVPVVRHRCSGNGCATTHLMRGLVGPGALLDQKPGHGRGRLRCSAAWLWATHSVV